MKLILITQCKDEHSLLHLSCKDDKNINMVKYLLNYRCIDINIQNSAGYTPLHFTIFWNCPKIYKLLIDSGSDDTIKNYHGDSVKITY